MTPSRIKTAGHHVARYVLPIISAIWLFWTMLETKRMQGWFEAQDDFRHASRPFFAFPTAEFAFAAIFVIASWTPAKTAYFEAVRPARTLFDVAGP
ncbi:hypothetical protein [Sphingomonas sp. ACRSK]|uniref:hypothetical protein n=1 Tax=Sphingomonas sp. ACRSK TaxID=2918213 RepID=UPI001EF61605|nr:hypothetical protein [Sphingomonas sp. ACRSK]MCG7350066.1 hypothetical protein [Sphingomonas sp. ACRSK]